MKDSAGRILLKYCSMVILLFGLLGFSLYTSVRRSRISSRAVSTCITTTVVIATSVNKLAILFMNPTINEASIKIGSLP